MIRTDLAALHARLVDFLASGEAAATIEGLLRQPKQLADVVSGSYAHPNGFRKLVVGSAGDGTRVRVHHWPRGEAEPSNVHNHRWAFASAIVAGGLRSALFTTLAEHGEVVDRYLFEPSGPGGRYGLSRRGEERIAVTSIAEYGPGSTYALNSDQLHRVHAKPNTLSVVISGPAERDRTDVFRSPTLASQPRELPLLQIADVRESLELLANKLEA